MRTRKKMIVFLLTAMLVYFTGYSMVYGAAGGVGAPWYPDLNPQGKTEYSGKLYITFLDTGKKFIPGGIGNQTDKPSYREYVVEVNFILELVPKGPHAVPRYFAGIGKTCEWYDESFPVCPVGADPYNDMFYLPGDYVTRIGAALHSFLAETVYPILPGCDSGPCFLKDAPFDEGTGNAEEAVNPDPEDGPPPPPWFWVQPLTIVTP